MKSNERQWRANIPDDLAEQFVADMESRGMTNREGTIRLMRLYLSLEPDVRTLGMSELTPERKAMLARAVLRQMAQGESKGKP